MEKQSGEENVERGGTAAFTLNADQLEGPRGVCARVCACPELSHRAQAHLALLDNTTGLLAPQGKKKSELSST